MALNLNTLATPGVYIDEVPLLPPSVAAVETAIPVFIGFTGTPLDPSNEADYDSKIKNTPIKISFLREYEEYFGKPKLENANFQVNMDVVIDTDADDVLGSRQLRNASLGAVDTNTPSHHIMHYAMQLFYQNGGGDCYVISVGQYNESGADSGLSPIGNETTDGLLRGLIELKSADEPTLILIPEAIFLNNGDYTALMKGAMDQAEELKDRFALIDVKTTGNLNDDQTNFRDLGLGDNLRYGAAYYPYLETIIDYYFGETKTEAEDVAVSITAYRYNDSNALELVPDDDVPAQLGADGLTIENLRTSNLSDLYNSALQALANHPMQLPPCPAVAGIYNTVDRQRGVWKAPANVTVGAVTAPSVRIDDRKQESLNIDANTGKSINAIRTLSGRGTVIWGARTLDGNDNEWRYIPVRRFFNFVEESVKKATYQFVFEPNDANTWNTIRAMIENFLTVQWNLGALQGAKPEDAFFVRAGLGQTMTAQDILNGRLIVEIGMAVVRPAEFIILRFMHKLPES